MLDQSGQQHAAMPTEMTDRQWARAQVEKKHKLREDLVAYVVINVALVAVWAFTGFGYFWPGWILGGWGVFLLLDVWNLHYRHPVTDKEVDEELRRRG